MDLQFFSTLMMLTFTLVKAKMVKIVLTLIFTMVIKIQIYNTYIRQKKVNLVCCILYLPWPKVGKFFS